VAKQLARNDLDTWRAFLNAHAAVIGRIEADLAAAGLPPLDWYDVLWPIYRAPDRRLRMRDLAGHVVLSRTGMTRLVDRIEAAGCLRREPVPGDRRGAYATITPAGVRLLRKMWPVYERAVAEEFVPHVRPHRAVIRDALERIAAG
jgi:DNA-binding MarR family transcriptional regulator